MSIPGEEPPGWRARMHDLASRWYGPSPANAGFSWIGTERIAIGSVPTAESVIRLAGQGVTHVVNCRARAEVVLSQDLAAERIIFGSDHVVHAPMRDLGQPQHPRLWAAAARFAASALDQTPQARVLIHCQQGRRRSAMLAYAVLRLRGHGTEDASELILNHRTMAELVPAYVHSVERWLNSIPTPPSALRSSGQQASAPVALPDGQVTRVAMARAQSRDSAWLVSTSMS